LLKQILTAGPDVMRRYPDASSVQRMLAQRVGVDSSNVIVTCGGDDALDRLCRAVLCPGRELLTTDPSFEMLPRYARIMGAKVTEVDWHSGPYPTDEIISQISPDTAMVAVVSPNNPSGAVATADDLRRISAAAPDAVLLVDLAYVEFADVDLTPVAISLPNTVIVRTLSKAWSCAGLRVGYAVGPREIIGWMRASGGPYAVARPSIALAAARLEAGEQEMLQFVAQVREDRKRIIDTLRRFGQQAPDSQGNFVYALLRDALWLRDVFAGMGIAVRAYPGHPRLANALRITCPGNRDECDRVVKAIEIAYAPEALVFALDGGLVDVCHSKLRSMVKASERIGSPVTLEEITEAQSTGAPVAADELLHQILQKRGVGVGRAEVADTYRDFYIGADNVQGLQANEKPLIQPADLKALSEKLRLVVLSDRDEAETAAVLDPIVKEGVRLEVIRRGGGSGDALQAGLAKLGVTRAWLIGETPWDMATARAAGLLPLGVVGSHERPQLLTKGLYEAGAARVFNKAEDVKELLP
jgi:histidinol-phosphate aminotransferase